MQLIKYKLQLLVLNEPLYIYRFNPKSNSDFERYLQVLIAYEYLLQDEDYDKDIHNELLKKYIEVARYGIFLVSIKGGNWKNVFRMAYSSPRLVREFLHNIQQFCLRRWLTVKNSIKVT